MDTYTEKTNQVINVLDNVIQHMDFIINIVENTFVFQNIHVVHNIPIKHKINKYNLNIYLEKNV